MPLTSWSWVQQLLDFYCELQQTHFRETEKAKYVIKEELELSQQQVTWVRYTLDKNSFFLTLSLSLWLLGSY